MERRTAIATSLTIFATVAVGTMAFASLGGIDILGFGGDDQQATPTIISQAPVDTNSVVTGDVTTTVVVDPVQAIEPVTTDATGNPVPVSVGGPSPTAPRGTTPGAPGTTAGPDPTTAPTPAPTPAPTSPPTVAPTSPPTTTPRTTSPPTTTAPKTTLPPGVPSDWPPGKPIPPMPVGCKNGQLEDNGVWNCQH